MGISALIAQHKSGKQRATQLRAYIKIDRCQTGAPVYAITVITRDLRRRVLRAVDRESKQREEWRGEKKKQTQGRRKRPKADGSINMHEGASKYSVNPLRASTNL